MATSLKNLSAYDKQAIPNSADCKIGIVVSEWNDHITHKLLEGAVTTFLENGVKEEQLFIHHVPGAFELPLGAQWLLENQNHALDGVLVIGVVIQGETRHFDFICDAAAHGIMDVSMAFNMPVIFGVLTTNDVAQAKDRAGGKHGNKGVEAAHTALQMIALKKNGK